MNERGKRTSINVIILLRKTMQRSLIPSPDCLAPIYGNCASHPIVIESRANNKNQIIYSEGKALKQIRFVIIELQIRFYFC